MITEVLLLHFLIKCFGTDLQWQSSEHSAFRLFRTNRGCEEEMGGPGAHFTAEVGGKSHQCF